ncbi:MAG: hypothetical protein J6Q79_02920 [Clostridia bacterium]|nr:hypothetical protein [Clostridia bacterium]
MTKKRKITAWVIGCLFWEFIVVGLYIYMCSQLKFPKLNIDSLGWLVPVFIVIPLLALLFGVLSVRGKKELMEAFSIIFAVLSALLYCAHIFLSIFLLSPIMSDTKNKDNYLVFDSDFVWVCNDIVEVIPEDIPENATNVVYNYRYEPLSHGWMYVYWELPEDEYEAFKNETLKKDGTVTETDRGVKFCPSWNEKGLFSVWLELILNDENNSISCKLDRSFTC